MNRPDNTEAKMARADLFKLAQYSFKLFKMVNDNQELEGWVQAKITKAADYIASVYHYMEYEMKVNEYGDAIESADMYSESVRRAFQQKLTEAKEQAKKAKAAAEKAEKALDEERSSTGGEITRGKGFTRHTHNPDRFSDEPHAEPPSKAKSKSAAEKAKDKAYDKAQEKDSKAWGKANPGKQTIMKGGVKSTNEAAPLTPAQGAALMKSKDPNAYNKMTGQKTPAKPTTAVSDPEGVPAKPVKEAKKAKKDYDGDGKVETGKDEYLGSKIAAAKKAGKLKEGTCSVCKKKPCECSTNESRQEKTTMKHVKNPTAGEKKAAKDIKPGIAGYKDRVDMLKSAEKDGRLKEGSKPDFLDMDKDGNKKEPMKKAVADKKKNPFAKK